MGVCSGRPRCALFDLEKLKLDFYILSSGAEILDKDLNIIQDFPMKKRKSFNKSLMNIINMHKSSYKQEMQMFFYTTLKEDYNPKLKFISSF